MDEQALEQFGMTVEEKLEIQRQTTLAYQQSCLHMAQKFKDQGVDIQAVPDN